MMKFKLYNTLTKQIEELEPLKEGNISIYTCGPTVYNYQHIGNFRCFVLEDILVRALKWSGYEVKRVMNVTDVGHLVSDEDEGEDKLEVGAKREGINAWEVARKYTDVFLKDFDVFGLLRPDSLVRVTERIPEQIEFIKGLESAGLTYTTSDGVYFDTTRIADYGKLAHQDLTALKAGIRVEIGDKKNPTDFALWKFSPKDQKRAMEWDSPWGVGFPGWHIECSTIARLELGDQIDIHVGGVEHIPVHHTNEIAQTEGLTGKQFSKVWMHIDHLLADGGKMAKSQGNGYSLGQMLEMGYEANSLKYFFYQASYRVKQNFTFEGLKAAQAGLNRLKGQLQALKAAGDDEELSAESKNNISEIISNDLDTPKLLAYLHELVKDENISDKQKILSANEIEKILNLGLFEVEKIEIPEEVNLLAKLRSEARANKDFAKSDEIRSQIEEKGFAILDTTDGWVLTNIKK